MNKSTEQQILEDLEGALLASILTITEVCKMWAKSRRTVEMAVWRDKIKGRQSAGGGVYLLDRASCVAFFGPPKLQLEDIE